MWRGRMVGGSYRKPRTLCDVYFIFSVPIIGVSTHAWAGVLLPFSVQATGGDELRVPARAVVGQTMARCTADIFDQTIDETGWVNRGPKVRVAHLASPRLTRALRRRVRPPRHQVSLLWRCTDRVGSGVSECE
jgi:hypothetical protein